MDEVSGINSKSRLRSRVFVGMVLVSVVAVAGTASPASAPSGPYEAQFGDSISPGFFSPPPGVKPVNAIVPSRLPHARRSYAWRIHGGKRQLLTFSTPIQHVIVIYMENRTPEDLFGALYNVTNPSTGNTFGTDLDLINPSTVNLTPEPLTYGENPGHKHYEDFYNEAQGMWPITAKNSGYWYIPTPSGMASPSVSNYITLIEDWAYDNHTLQSNEGPSFVAHQYAIAAQSGGLSGSDIAPNGITENPGPGGGELPGNGTCFTSTSQTTRPVDMYSPYPTPSPTPAPLIASPCVEYSTILDYMASAAPTTSPYYQWQYIAKDDTSIWSAPMSIDHLYQAYSADPNPSKTGQPFAVDPDAENFVLNITLSVSPTPNPARPFAELTFVTPCLGESDHPNTAAPHSSSYDDGPDWLAYVLNAIGGSLYFPNTAVIVTWDDWGGFYDNFSPSPWPYHPTSNPYSPPSPGIGGNRMDPNEWGFRVPLIMISPYVKSKGYISSTLVSQGAILNFIETVFDLPTNALKGDDATNGSNDLTDMLNFSVSPTPWSELPTNFTPGNNATCPPASS
jgi:phospholipase C